MWIRFLKPLLRLNPKLSHTIAIMNLAWFLWRYFDTCHRWFVDPCGVIQCFRFLTSFHAACLWHLTFLLFPYRGAGKYEHRKKYFWPRVLFRGRYSAKVLFHRTDFKFELFLKIRPERVGGYKTLSVKELCLNILKSVFLIVIFSRLVCHQFSEQIWAHH